VCVCVWFSVCVCLRGCGAAILPACHVSAGLADRAPKLGIRLYAHTHTHTRTCPHTILPVCHVSAGLADRVPALGIRLYAHTHTHIHTHTHTHTHVLTHYPHTLSFLCAMFQLAWQIVRLRSGYAYMHIHTHTRTHTHTHACAHTHTRTRTHAGCQGRGGCLLHLPCWPGFHWRGGWRERVGGGGHRPCRLLAHAHEVCVCVCLHIFYTRVYVCVCVCARERASTTLRSGCCAYSFFGQRRAPTSPGTASWPCKLRDGGRGEIRHTRNGHHAWPPPRRHCELKPYPIP